MNTIHIKIIGHTLTRQLKKRINRLIPRPPLEIDTTTSLQKTAATLPDNKYAVLILTDEVITASGENILAILQKISDKSPKTQILILAEEKNIKIAVTALKSGTYQYVRLPVSDTELKMVVETAIEEQPQIIDKRLIRKNHQQKFGEIIGRSTPMLHIYDQILQAAQTDIPVLILGETGTGKDLVAYTIHKKSQREAEPYLAVNLGALPSELVGSELFGHEKGAFTGALHQHKGVFEQGNTGTVFLDEIDTMDEKVQVSLLRLLEQKKFKRLGGTRALNSKARLIAATNENLDDLVKNSVFRQDLFYRLDVFRITLPPLKQRKSDIPLLVEELLLKYARTYKKNITSVNQDAMDALMQSDWPGNVRELKNVIQRAVLVCPKGILQIEHLPPRFQKDTGNSVSVSFKIGTPLQKIEREMIIHALAATQNNRKEAARLLGISRRALYNKLDKHNL